MTIKHEALCFLFGFIILPLAAVNTLAEEAEGEKQDDLPTYPLEDIVVTESKEEIPHVNTIAAKMPVPLRSTPASVGVVTNARFKSQDGAILGDALKNVSGVNVQTGFGVHDFFIIRGFDSLSSGLVLTDGASEPEVTFYHLYNMDRVEVLKGPGAFLYGGNPLSGSVNLSRKQPIFKTFAQLTGSYGHHASFRGALDAGLADLNTGVAFRLNALRQVSDNYRDEKDSETWAVYPALTWRPNDKSTITFSFEYINSQYKSDSGLPVVNNALPDVPRTRSYQSPFDISDQKIYRARVDFNTRINPSVTLRSKLYYTDFDWLSKGALFSGVFPNAQGGLDLFRSLLLLDDHQKVLGNQLEALFSFRTGSVRHTLLAGVELSRWKDVFTLDVAALPGLDLFTPVETAAEPLSLIPNQSQAADAKSLIVAPYIVDRISFSETFQAFLGGRYDRIDYDDRVTTTNRKYKKLSPMLGLVFSPAEDLSFYANTGRAFAPPSSQIVGDRKAEESTQFEIGIKKYLLDDRLNVTLALYHLKKDNIAIPDATGVTRQDGDQRSRGLELELMVQPAPNWYTFAAYAFSRAELTRFSELVMVPTQTGITFNTVDHSGNTPAFAPRHILNLWTTRNFKNGVGIGGGARYISSQYIAEDNQYQIDAVLTFNATLSYSYNKTRWRVNLKNLTNRKHETRGFGSASVIPANPFGLYGAFELNL